MQQRHGSSADPIQNIQRPVVMLSKSYQSGHQTALHAHPRVQFLYAISGAMRASTASGSWIVPTGYGLVIPQGMRHQVEMFGQVSLQSVYISPDRLKPDSKPAPRVIPVSRLLAASLDRFATRPLEYCRVDIAHHLAHIVLMEVSNIPSSPLALPFPSSRQLRSLCDSMLAKPCISKTIDHWAHEAGMSRRSFTRAFKRETGLSFDIWRQRLRYQVAAAQLAEGATLKQVAATVGYGSVGALKSMMGRLINS